MQRLNQSFKIHKGSIFASKQGAAFVCFSCLNLVAACLFLLLPAEQASHFFFDFQYSLFLWPILLFIVFVRRSPPDFTGSWRATFFVSVYGIMPFLIPMIRNYKLI
jgi:hypothetical protein